MTLSTRDILRDAWELTAARTQLHIFGTLSALFSILIGIPRLHYILRTDIIGWEKIYVLLKTLLKSPTTAGAIVGIAFALLYCVSFLTHVLSEGAIIAAVAKERSSGEPVERRTAFALGLSRFLPFIEFKFFTNFFSISSITIWILLFDYYSAKILGGTSIVRQFLPVTALIVFVVFIFSVAFTYSEVHFIVRRSTIVGALKRSIRLVAFYLSETVLLLVLLLLIFARTLVNVLLVFLLPGAVVALTTLLTAKLAPATSLAIIIATSLVAIWLAARISGVLIVFTNAVWTITYLELDARKDDVIIHEANDDAKEAKKSDLSLDAPIQPAPQEPPAAPEPESDVPMVQVLPGSGPSADTILHPEE